MRAWREGDYPVSPFIYVTACDESGPRLESAQLMTPTEIDHFFNRIIFELKLLPKYAEQSRGAAKRELAHQQARMLRRA
jgi:hypothetical protein